MFANKKWSIGSYIRNLRKEQGVTLNQLCYGICSVPTMNRIETEDRADDVLLIERILQRLGLNTDKFELYSGKNEFEQLEQRTRIQTWLRDGDFQLAEEEVLKYQQKWRGFIDKDKLQLQFVKNVLGHVAMHKGNLKDGILFFEQAIEISVPDWNKENLFDFLLGDDEIKLLISLADVHELLGEKSEAFSLRINLIEYIKKYHLPKDLKPQLATEVICKTVKFLIEQGNAEIALELCDQGLKILSDTKRMFHWPDLLSLKGKCLEEIYSNELSENSEIIEGYQRAYYIYELFGESDSAHQIKDYLREKYAWELT